MSRNHSEPSTSSSSSTTSRARPSTGRSSSSYTVPRRPVTFQSHRRASGSALTIQTQFAKQPNPSGQQAPRDHPHDMHFSCLLNSVLGSPYLTTTDIPTSSNFGLHDTGREGPDINHPPPPSPTPTADYSIIDTEELEADSYRVPGGYPGGHQRSMSSSFTGFGFQSSPTWSRPRSRTYCTSTGLGGSSFMSLNHPTESISLPNIQQQGGTLKTLLPRIWDVISSPTKAFSGNNNSSLSLSTSSASVDSSPTSSPRIPPNTISLPTSLISGQLPPARQSSIHWDTLPKTVDKGKRRAQSSRYSSFALDSSAEDLDLGGLSPLDGEEGELIDEACFVDIRAITGVDILALLPRELAIYILRLVCPPPFSPSLTHTRSSELGPLSSEPEEESQVSLRAMLACLAVSHTWRRLASDNSVWHALFLGRWDIDLRKAKESHLRKPEPGSPPPNLIEPSSHQRKKQRWKLKPKAQALKFGTSSKSRVSFPSVVTDALTCSSPEALKELSLPKQNYPLQFDWKKMYMERFELEKRWKGTAVVQQPAFPVNDPQLRDTGRVMSRRNSPRSRSLSPSTLLDYGNAPQSPTLGRTSGGLAQGISPSNTSPLFREQKWEPKATELIGHTDRYVLVLFSSRYLQVYVRLEACIVLNLIPNGSLLALGIARS